MSESCNILDLRPKTLIIKKVIGDTLEFSAKLTDDDGNAISLQHAEAVDYYLDGEIVCELLDGVTISGLGHNIINVKYTIPSEEVGELQHKIVVTDSDSNIRTYFKGKVVSE